MNDIRRGPRTWRWRMRIWFWKHVQEPLIWAGMNTVNHARAWKHRYQDMEEHEDIDLVQFVFSVFSIIIAAVLIKGHGGPNSSAFERMVDLRLPYHFLGLSVHRWCGWIVLIGGLSWLVGLMEWRVAASQEARTDTAFDRNMLHILTRMQLCGVIIAGTYWALSLMLTLMPLDDPFRIAPWASLFLAKVHQFLAKRVSRKYVRARYEAEKGYVQRHSPPIKVAVASGLTVPVLLLPPPK